ncbi:spore germination protein [Sutcliffiella horikoshii]|uniref:spore germination protein n=1 Tax=Sutcliffiella horikoshii TaxID=79883 RepID=UPI001CBDD9FF|nr:spore germination protein [Sutcliffiella horikoshii]UAL46788.1 spore germination protein [Sutcliffiella horikoshii]
MSSLLGSLKDKLSDSDDFFVIEEEFNQTKFEIIGVRSLVDLAKSLELIEKHVTTATLMHKGVLDYLISNGKKISKEHEIITAVLEGELILVFEDCENFVVSLEPIRVSLSRPVEQPTNGSVLQGPLNSFNEERLVNIGILRKRLVSDQLRVKDFLIGKRQKKNVSISYDAKSVNKKLLQKTIELLENGSEIELQSIQDLMKVLKLSPWSAVGRIHATEIPQQAASCLVKGKVVVFIDGFPFAYILPSTFWDIFILENDKNFPMPITVSIRVLRLIGVMIALIAPGLYVALVAVNPEVLRIELALSIAQSRNGVPYPALVEIILMLVILELIVEASIRLPQSIGPTITMVGGIILGQAAVEAKLVSNLLIIVLAATTIANATVIGYQNLITIRMLKYTILILASIFGVLGIMAGVFLICGYFASINTLGVPYLNMDFSKGDINSG